MICELMCASGNAHTKGNCTEDWAKIAISIMHALNELVRDDQFVDCRRIYLSIPCIRRVFDRISGRQEEAVSEPLCFCVEPLCFVMTFRKDLFRLND